MRALSVKQPWAELIARGTKKKELRTAGRYLRACSLRRRTHGAPAAISRRAAPVVSSRRRRANASGFGSWAAIVGPTVEPIPFEIPYDRMAVAARVTVEDA